MKFGNAPTTLGIIANEFFDPTISRIGGFGMLSRQITQCVEQIEHPKLAVHLFHGDPPKTQTAPLTRVYNRPTHAATGSWRRDKYKLLLTGALPKIWLSVDYRPNYEYFLWMSKRSLLIMWVQDPKTPDDWERIRTCFVPGQEGVEPQGLGYVDCLPLAELVRRRHANGARTIFTVPSAFLTQKIEATYGVVPHDIRELCYPVEPIEGPFSKADTPLVTFLGRLDPQKRPWIAAAVAEQMPDVRFQFLGRPHFKGPGSWPIEGLPPNVDLIHHVDGVEKIERLGASWLMLNTSIHEGLPISFVEGLQCETPIVSCVNPEGVVSRFGAYVGEYRGSGMDAVRTVVTHLRQLLDNPALRASLGYAGRKWANDNHSQARFASQLGQLCAEVSLKFQSSRGTTRASTYC